MTARRNVRLVAVAAIALLALVIVVLVASGGDDRRQVRAEFVTARGLIPDNFVRVNGVKAGKVTDVDLTDRGTAMVTMRVDNWVPALRPDASAMIRPADLFGDVYLSLDPGSRPGRLGRAIGLAHSANVGRLDDLLRVFDQPARAGLRATLVELGTAVDKQGVNINRAVLRARPTLRAAQEVMDQLASDRASLRTLISQSDRVIAQTARRHEQLAPMIGHFASLLRTTAGSSGDIRAALQELPATLDQLTDTTTRLGRAADDARPLAEGLGAVAPGLATTATRLGPFLRTAERVVAAARPTVRRLSRILAVGATPFAKLSAGLYELQQGSPELRSFVGLLRAAAPQLNAALAVATAEEGNEPGNQPLDPTTNPLRHYWRGAGVLTCETFGFKVRPGCLADFLGPSTRSRSTRRHRARTGHRPKQNPAPAPAPPKPAAAPSAPERPTIVDKVDKAVSGIVGALGGGPDDAAPDSSVQRLLDYLLKP